MTTARLFANWLVGLVLVVAIEWGLPALQRRSAHERTLETLRRDSLAAASHADAIRTTRGDSVRAYVFTPPDPLELDKKRIASERVWREVLVLLVAAWVLGNTAAWRRGRNSRANAPAT